MSSERHRYSTTRKTKHYPHISKGDTAIVYYETLPHGLWKLGRIQVLLIECDGLPRVGTSESCFKRSTVYSVEIATAAFLSAE